MSAVSIGRAWDETKAALQAHRRLVVPLALGLLLLPAVIVAMIEPPTEMGQQPEPGLWMLPALALFVVMMIGQLSLVLLVNGWRGSLGEAIGKGARRVPVFLLAAIMVIIPAALIASVILVMTAGVDATGAFNPATAGPGAGLAIIVLVIFILFLSTRLMLTAPIIASEPVGAFAALRRSFALTSGNFWRLLAFVLMLVIAFVIAGLTVGAVVGSLITLALGPAEPWSVSRLLMALVGGLVQTAFVVVYTAMLARIYAQLATPATTVPEVKREG